MTRPRSSTQPVYGLHFHQVQEPGSARSAQVIVPIVVDLLRPRSVVDVGCGSGVWLAEFKCRGVGEVLGIEGPPGPSSFRAAPDELIVRDLSESLHLARAFDLAVSLEVAEHLPERRAAAFVAELTRLAPAILFSAAVPHQGGTGHVNEQWPEYWAQLFAEHGYAPVDCVRSQVWADPSVEFWYAQNILLFVRHEVVASNAKLQAAAALTRPEALSRIHPTLYTAKVEHPELSLPTAAAALRATLGRVAKNAVRRLSLAMSGVSRRIRSRGGHPH